MGGNGGKWEEMGGGDGEIVGIAHMMRVVEGCGLAKWDKKGRKMG